MAKTTYSREELERQLSESRREFLAADVTTNNLELRLAEMAERLANAESKLEAAEKRIAELEARGIRLPERSSMLHRTDFNEDYQTVMAYKVSEVIAAIRAAGIRITGE